MAGLEFRLLGDVTAVRDGQPIFLGPARPRGVLAVLLLAADNPVSLDDIVERVWGGNAPKQARSSLHSYFTRLRLAFAGETDLVRHGHGYTLHVDAETVDVHRFRRLAALAREGGQVRHFDEALALWRGEPFAGLESPWLDEVRTALRAEHESVLLDRADLKLELGQHAEILPDLAVRAERNLLDERLAGQLMLALHRSGRQADALRHFQKVRNVLAEELGVDPGASLKAVHQVVVRDETEAAVVPRQLPAAPRVFAGRKAELATLAESALTVIVGPGGIGKTTLALHWAHDNVDRFPDGQLYVNLSGVEPPAAMRNLLLALGIGPGGMPEDHAAIAGLYRSVLADKRMLIVLDNAHDAEQVVALLPGGAACSVVVTSRNRLTSLVSFNNATLVGLDVLDPADAYAILVSRLGSARLETEPAAVDELLAACGGLPLALSIIVGRAQEHPDFSLASLASELRDAGLNAFEVDTDLSIRAALAASVAALSTAQADLFALLGLAPGPDIGLAAAAALAGRTYASARTTLRALERGSLIQQHSPGRFRMHDLVRRYAGEQAADRFPDTAREAALRRLTDFYLHTLIGAAHRVDPGRPMISIGPPAAGCEPLTTWDEDESRRWVATETATVAAVRRLAEQRGWHQAVWQFAWGLNNFNAYGGSQWDELAGWRSALASAQAVGDLEWIGLAHRFIARAAARVGDQDEALEHARVSLWLAEDTGSDFDRIFALMTLAEIHWRQRRSGPAAALATRAWRLARGHPAPVRARVANDLAWYLAQDRRYGEAWRLAESCVDLYGPDCSPLDLASVLDTLGYICRRTGRLDQAVGYLRDAAAAMRGNPFSVADTLCTLGETYRELGRNDEAAAQLREALAIYERQHRIPDARRTREMLAGLTVTSLP